MKYELTAYRSTDHPKGGSIRTAGSHPSLDAAREDAPFVPLEDGEELYIDKRDDEGDIVKRFEAPFPGPHPTLPCDLEDRDLLAEYRHLQALDPQKHADEERFESEVETLRSEIEGRGHDPEKIAPGEPCHECLPDHEVELSWEEGQESTREHPGDRGAVYCPRCGLEWSTTSDEIDWERAFAYDVGPDDPREPEWEDGGELPPLNPNSSSKTTMPPSSQKARDYGEWTNPHSARGR